MSQRISSPTFGMIAIVSSIVLSSTASAIDAQLAAGDPLRGLTADQLARFNQGKIDYQHLFIPAEGLGPAFNKASCASCHANPLGGTGSISVTRFGTVDGRGQFDPLAELGGSLRQESAIQDSPEFPIVLPKGILGCGEVVPPEATIEILRVTNGAIGYGLVEAIPDSAILSVVRAQRVGGMVSGKPHMVVPFETVTPRNPRGVLRVGRFGWKAQVATILTFSADAGLNEIGITNRFVMDENAPGGDFDVLAACDLVADPEDAVADKNGRFFIDRITDFQRFMSAPPQAPRSGMSGETIFMTIGCGQCHTPTFVTANDPTLEPALRNKIIKPYGDWLLHDMGDLGDDIVQGVATGKEMKTAPLWGIGFRDPIMHDGRVVAGSFYDRIAGPEGAIYWHSVNGSEAQASAMAFMALSQDSKDKVVDFLYSLGRRDFDVTEPLVADAFIDLDDFYDLNNFIGFHDCYGGRYSPDEPCAVHDVNQDGAVNEADYHVFATVYTGANGDCNQNGVDDVLDILNGTSLDRDLNGIPDECCAEDLTLDGVINGQDLAVLLGEWGLCQSFICPADLDHNGFVNGLDLAMLLGAWGPCK